MIAKGPRSKHVGCCSNARGLRRSAILAACKAARRSVRRNGLASGCRSTRTATAQGSEFHCRCSLRTSRTISFATASDVSPASFPHAGSHRIDGPEFAIRRSRDPRETFPGSRLKVTRFDALPAPVG
jgi:hypothetical protein